MTAQEAIKIIKAAKAEVEWECPLDYAAAFDVAIEALEKQIPQKPNMIQSIYNANLWFLYCPSCENYIGMWNSMLERGDMYNVSNRNICPYCGRVIDCTGGGGGGVMGVYINGMEMPKDCMECPFSDYEAWCLIPGVISEHCPLVEVPEPHGRLIDENELTVSTDNIVSKIMIFGGQVCYSRSDIDNASTVIEAEGE